MRPLMSAVAPVVALALAGFMGLPGLTTSSSAAPDDSISDLQTALTTCTGTTGITLTQTLTDTAGALQVRCNTTINLAGYDLTVRNIGVDAGKTLTVTDSTVVGGTLTADASNVESIAGIRITGAALTTSGTAHVIAIGGASAAGIGGGYGGAGGATTSNNASSITATGGPDDVDGDGAGAGIGSGAKAGGGTTTINGGSTITASASTGASAVGTGQYATPAVGTFLKVVNGTLRLPGGSALVVRDAGVGVEVTIGVNGRVTGTAGASPTYGTATGAGQITNDGAIALPAANITATYVTGHHYLVSFDTVGGSTAPATENVYADTFTRGARTFPGDPTRTESVFSHWNSQANGAGVVVYADTQLPGSSADGSARALTLYARYGGPTDAVGNLQIALSTCTGPTSLTLTQDLTGPAAPLQVSCTTTIDLAGHDLTVRNVVVATGKTLTVTDSTPVDGGTLTADATGADNVAGIRTTGAALVTSGTAHLIATGSYATAGIGGASFGSGGVTTSNDSSSIVAHASGYAAAIGGGTDADGGTTTSNDSSSIVATADFIGAGIGGGSFGAGGTTTSNDTSSITATGGPDDGSDYPNYSYGAGAGIGSGPYGTGAGTTTVNDDSTITATGGAGASAVGIGEFGVATAGTFLAVASGTLRLPGGSILDVPVSGSGARVTIGANGRVAGTGGPTPTYGTITGAGRITNGGAIALPTANITATSIWDHRYAVSFDTQGGSTAPAPVHVYADTFTHGDRSLPADPTITGSVFSHWNTEADGTGSVVHADTQLPGTSSDGTAHALTLYARYGVATDTISNVQSALTSCTGPTAITLTKNLTSTSTALDVVCNTTIDLAGYDLTVRNVVVATGTTLTVTDSTPVDGGTLTADASSANFQAGIRTTGAALITTGTAHLAATGGQSSAGIGGAPNGAGGSTTSNDSSSIIAIAGSFAAAIGGGSFGGGGLTTSNGSSSIIATGVVVGAGIGGGYSGAGGTTTSNGTSTITATGGAGDSSDPDDTYPAGAGIGGGPGGSGAGTTTINDDSTITATGGAGASAVGIGEFGVATAGTFLAVASGTLRLPGGSILDVPVSGAGARVTIGASGLITGTDDATPTYGTITGAGQVTNGGAITLPTTNITATSISNHDYLVSFDTRGGSTDPDDARVYADTFTDGDRDFPADPTRTGYTFNGWYTQADGAGTPITATSTLPGASSDGAAVAMTAYASWSPVSTPPPATTPVVVPNPVVTPASPVVGDVLTAAVGTTTPSGATLTYQWNRTGTAIAAADQATYTTAKADVGARLSVTVTATMSGYDTGRSTSAPTEPVQDAPVPDGTIPDPQLEIQGASQVGDTLSGAITRPDVDGLTLTWQWQRLANDNAATDLVDATGPAYAPRPGQVGQQLRLVLTLAAPGYTTLVVHRDSGSVQAGHLDRLRASVTGTAAPGRRLVVATTAPADVPAGYTLSYQWKLDGKAIKSQADRRVYRPRQGQIGRHLTVTVTATAPGYATVQYVSQPRVVHPRRH